MRPRAREATLGLLLLSSGCAEFSTFCRCVDAELRKDPPRDVQPPLVQVPQGYPDALYAAAAALGAPARKCLEVEP